jgi:hypothetical protein
MTVAWINADDIDKPVFDWAGFIVPSLEVKQRRPTRLRQRLANVMKALQTGRFYPDTAN